MGDKVVFLPDAYSFWDEHRAIRRAAAAGKVQEDHPVDAEEKAADGVLVAEYLAHCWMPVRICLRWLKEQGIPAQADWLPAADVTNSAETSPQSPTPSGTPTGPHQPDQPAAISPPAKRARGLDYSEADQPLIIEMRSLIKACKAGSPENAARAVVERAMGGGTENSKVARLAKRYRERFSV